MKKLIIFAGIAMLSLSGCDKIKDATKKDIEVKDIKFKFEMETTDGTTKAGTMIKTSGTESSIILAEQEVEIKAEDIEEYRDKVIDVLVGRASVTAMLPDLPGEQHTVTNLKVEAMNLSQEIPPYTVGEAFNLNENMKIFLGKLCLKLMKQKVLVKVTGEIDVPTGTKVTVSIDCDAVFTVKLL